MRRSSEALPTLFAQNSARYAGYSLRKVCKEMHDFYRKANVKELAEARAFRASSFPEFAMSSKDAYEALVANEVDYVPLDAEHQGPHRRDARTHLSTRHRRARSRRALGFDRAQPMLDYFSTFEESFNRFPGFNYEVQGVYQEQVNGRIKFHTYVVRQ